MERILRNVALKGGNMKKVILVLILTFAMALSASVTQHTIHIQQPKVQSLNHYQIINIDSAIQHGTPGNPSLPYFGVTLLLPIGEEAQDVTVTRSGKHLLSENFNPYPVQNQYPLSYEGQIPFTPLSDNIESETVFPAVANDGFSTNFYSGFPLLSTAVTPIEFNPQTGEIFWFDTVAIRITSAGTQRAQRAEALLKTDTSHVNKVSNMIENPELLASIATRPQDTGNINYLIVAEESKIPNWEAFKEIHINRGLSVEIVSYESIIATQTGIDNQDKVRNYIIDVYQDNPLQYVLLAGDVDVIPHRGLYASVNNEPDLDIPADMYYACLDGNWNTDGDDRWGEANEADLIPELSIGRFCYNNDLEINRFIDKVDGYLNSPVAAELKNVLFVGEDLGWTAWGGDYMDEMIDGSSNFGYTTVGAPSAEWDVDTLYDRDGFWSASELLAQMSSGPNMINHLGHANVGYTMKLHRNDITTANLTNNGSNHNFFTLFTQGCYCGSYDNRNSSGSYEADCITEKFTSIATGAVSMIANSRYGWGDGSSTNGASQHFHREYNDAIYGDNITVMGDALMEAKVASIPFITSGVMFWCDYETNLIGDPALDIWTESPMTQTITHLNEVFFGSTTFTVTTSEPNTLVSLHNGTQQYGSALSDMSGTAVIEFDEPLSTIETLTLTATKHNYNNYTANVLVIAANGPFITCNLDSFTEYGNYIDNSAQVLDTLALNLTFENIGVDPSNGDISVTLTTTNPFVALENATMDIPSLLPGSTASQPEAFSLSLLPGLLDDDVISLNVNMQDADDSWQSTLLIPVHMPALEYSNMTMESTSGPDPQLDPGETANLTFSYANNGSGYEYNLCITAMTSDPYVTISNATTIISSIDPGTIGTSSPIYISVSNDCPSDYTADIILISVDAYNNSSMETISLPVGTTAYTFENGMGEWTHEALSAGYTDQWHLDDYRNVTPNGSFSAKCGGQGAANYADKLHASLTTPVLNTFGNAYVKFHHWMSAETESATTAWDGGLIEISHNGGPFQSIQPVGGYPYTIEPNDDSPFDPGTPVFSGSINWDEVEISLADFPGTVQLRFIFGSDAAVTEEGWYIDDLVVGSYVDASNPVISSPEAIALCNYPNPFNPSTSIAFNLPRQFTKGILSIFNAKGQKVRSYDLSDLAGTQAAAIQWNGADDDNHPVASGVYFYQVQFDNSLKASHKMLLMK